jgi:hypothetical protein
MNVYFNASNSTINNDLTNVNTPRMNTNSSNNNTNNQAAQAAAILPSTSNNSANNNNPNRANNVVWGDNDVLDANDDFDSDQLDEDESYSWASTDNQDVMIGGGNHHNSSSNGGPNTGPNGAGGNSIANWRDWRTASIFRNASNFSLTGNRAALGHSSHSASMNAARSNHSRTNVDKLVIICAKYVAENVPFELVESHREPVPEDLQLKIAFHSFPDSIDTIRLYSCLANGNVDEYVRGEQLFHSRCVRRIIQIGFHLSAQVLATPAIVGNCAISSTSATAPGGRNHHGNSFWIGLSNTHGAGATSSGVPQTATAANSTNVNITYVNVAVLCDRKRIVSCTCTCSKQSTIWCCHIVAVCVHRILEHETVEFRAPVSESLSKLDREQLQKFAQYLISELPQQVSISNIKKNDLRYLKHEYSR